jgi:hypothetical protein
MNEECEIEAIVAMRRFGRSTRFFVKWKNCDSSQNTWEPPGNLMGARELFEQFLKSQGLPPDSFMSSPKAVNRATKKRIEAILSCRRSSRKTIVYTVNYEGSTEPAEVTSRSMDPENYAVLLDYLEGFIPASK